MSAENRELISLLQRLRRSGHKFDISWGYAADYELTVKNKDHEVVYNEEGVLRELLREACAQLGITDRAAE